MISKSIRYKIIAVFVTLYGLFLASEGAVAGKKFAELEKNGVTVPGVIENAKRQTSKSGRRRTTDYIIVASYNTPAGSKKTEFDVTLPFFESRISGQGPTATIMNPNVEIRYLQADPGTAIIVGGAVDKSSNFWFGIVVAVIGLGGLIFLFVRKPFAE